MCRFLVFVFSIFVVSDAFAVSYILSDEWFAKRSNEQLDSILASPEMEKDQMSTEISLGSNSGYMIEKGKIFSFVDGVQYGQVGETSDCLGLKGKCLKIEGILKFFVPENVSFDQSSGWVWEEYSFTAVVKNEYRMLGEELEVLEIVARCKSCNFKVVWSEYEKNRGLIGFKLRSDTSWLNYTLSDRVGLFVPSKLN